MPTYMMQALQLIVALLILVTIHEFGHYIFARIFGVKVNRFYLFFNPWFSLLKYYPDKGKIELIAWTKKVEGPDGKETEEPKALFTFKAGKPHSPVNRKGRPSWAATLYGIGWLPLGGYCDIAGMVDETKSAAELASEPQPWELRSKNVWQRFMVMVAGVMFNFLLAIVIYAGIAFHWGEHVVPFDKAYEGMDYAQPLVEAGFRPGDILLKVDGKEATPKNSTIFWDMVQPGTKVEVLRDHRDHITIEIPKWMSDSIVKIKSSLVTYRCPVFIDKIQSGMPAAKSGFEVGDRIIKVGNKATPSMTEFYPALESLKGQKTDITVLRDGREETLITELTENGKLGIQLRPIDKIYPVDTIKYSILGSIPRGWDLGTSQLGAYVSSLKLLFTKEGVQQVGGFGAIGGMFPESWDWYTFWQITAFLSVILAFMNIIPIPGLDGGYVLFLLAEMVTGKKVPDKYLEKANMVGFIFLMLLMILANGNDIIRAFQ